jgi:uncharacterized protein (DUF4415 family)
MSKTATQTSSKTNWEKVLNKTDEEIDLSDSPELTEEFFAAAQRKEPICGPTTTRVFRTDAETGEEITISETTTIRLQIEPDVANWFAAQGDDGEEKMRAALRIYAEAHR